MADIDGILERLMTDQGFRAQLSSDPAAALDGYDLSADDIDMLASSMDDGDNGQRGVEQRTSKSAVVGLLASLTGGGGHGGGGKAQASDIFAKTGVDDQGSLIAPSGQDGSASIVVEKIGAADPAHAAVDMFAPTGISGNGPADVNGDSGLPPGLINKTGVADPAQAAVDMFAPADITGNGSNDLNGDVEALPIKMGHPGSGEQVSPVVVREWEPGATKSGVGNPHPLPPAPPFGPDVQGNISALNVDGDIEAVPIKMGNLHKPIVSTGDSLDAPIKKIGSDGDLSPSQLLGNLAPPEGAQAPSVSETGGDGTKGLLNGLNGDAAEVNGDGAPKDVAGIQPWNGDSTDSPAELIGLLQPPTDDSTKGIDASALKAGVATEDSFLEIDG